MDSDKIVEAEIGFVHEVSLVEHAVEKDEDHGYIEKMESMIEKVLKIQQKTSAYLNLRLVVLYKELNGKLETLDAHVMMLGFSDCRSYEEGRSSGQRESCGK